MPCLHRRNNPYLKHTTPETIGDIGHACVEMTLIQPTCNTLLHWVIIKLPLFASLLDPVVQPSARWKKWLKLRVEDAGHLWNLDLPLGEMIVKVVLQLKLLDILRNMCS